MVWEVSCLSGLSSEKSASGVITKVIPATNVPETTSVNPSGWFVSL
jgi:hypothetical protein